jgi:SAM-dependent methyltransferase
MKVQKCLICDKSEFRLLYKDDGRRVVECQNDGLVFVNPRPSSKEVKNLYGPKYFKNFTPYIENKNAHLKYFRKKIVQVEERLGRKGKLLDVGCATGFLLSEARRRGWQVFGTDISDYAINYCKKNRLSVKKGLLKDLNFPKNEFDVIFSLQTIEHEQDPIAHVKEIRKLLKPTGVAVFTTPDHDTWTRKIMGRKWFGYRHKEHLFFLNKRTIKQILLKGGFSHIQIKTDDPRLFRLKYYMKRLSDFYPNRLMKASVGLVNKTFGDIAVPVPTDPWGDMIVFAEK